MPDATPDPIAPIPPTPPVQPPADGQARMWNMLCHLSALSGYFIPFGNILGPLLIWQIKKNEFPSVEQHGKAALNFQLTVIIAAVVTGAVGVVLSFFCIGFLGIIGAGLIFLSGIIFSIIAGLKANEGKDYKYPFSLKLIS